MTAKPPAIRVLVGGHDLKFWIPLQRRLEQDGRFEFRADVWSGHDSHDHERSLSMMAWADVIVAEWCLGNAVFYAKHRRSDQRLIVRFHLQERNTEYPGQIDYSKVDGVVFVGDHILRECVEKFAIPEAKACVVGNFVDTDRYDRPKLDGAEFNLGIIGTAPARKRLDLAVDTLGELLKHDDRYSLHVKGADPYDYAWLKARGSERNYYERLYREINRSQLRNRVVFDPPGDDVPEWFQGIGYLLSPSDFESFHMAVAEGLAAGSLPVVWAWEGADRIYRQMPLMSSPKQAAGWIAHLANSREAMRLREQGKRYARVNFDLVTVGRQWSQLLAPAAVPDDRTALRPSERRVLVIWAIDNWSTFHRREMIEALSLALPGNWDVIVIEPGEYVPAIIALGWADRAELRKVAEAGMVPISSNLHRARLLTGGMPPEWPRLVEARHTSQAAYIEELVRRKYGANAKVLHWIYKPDQCAKLPSGQPYVYEVYDDYTMDFGSGRLMPEVREAENETLAKAEHVFFTSSPLLERKGARARNGSLAVNGVNLAPFRETRVFAASRGRPVAGYLGNMSSFFDWRLMADVCNRMRHVDFAFYGQIELEKLGRDASDAYRAMAGLPNVRFGGRVERERGAAAVNRCDVLLIPFVVNEAMDAVNPLKLWEYFATGLPVVSTPMKAIAEYATVAAFAEGSEQWMRAIEGALESAGDDGQAVRLALAADHAWERLVSEHASIVMKVVEESEAMRNA